MSATIRQTATTGSAAGSTVALALAAAPRRANMLCAAIFCVGTDVTAPPDSSWALVASGVYNTDRLDVYTRIAPAAPASSYTFTTIGVADQISGILHELDGYNLVVNKAGVSAGETSTTHATPSLTPSILNCLAIAFLGVDDWTSTVVSVSAGWSVSDGSTYVLNNFHPGDARHQTLPTSDTTTAIQNTFTVNASTASGGVNDGLAALVLVGSGSVQWSAGKGALPNNYRRRFRGNAE